jgi:endogenous inhibitor of DNA gyrase (YacG/DUF329 family)
MMKVSCPICERQAEVEKTADWPEFPFCSRRCKTIDLGRWLSGRYALPSEREDESAPEEVS